MKTPFNEFGLRTWEALVERFPALTTYERAQDGPKIIQGALSSYVSSQELPVSTSLKFCAPSYDQVAAYFGLIGFTGDPADFLDYYQANGWMVGRVKMKDWMASARLWKRRNQRPGQGNRKASFA